MCDSNDIYVLQREYEASRYRNLLKDNDLQKSFRNAARVHAIVSTSSGSPRTVLISKQKVSSSLRSKQSETISYPTISHL